MLKVFRNFADIILSSAFLVLRVKPAFSAKETMSFEILNMELCLIIQPKW